MFQLQQDADVAASFKVGERGASGAARRVAILVAHGMGQQIPFQTMDAIHTGLLRVDGTPTGTPNTCALKVDGEWLHRIETPLKGGEVDAHIYEAYWAPLTEGRITLRDVIRFLAGAGRNAIRNARNGQFRRWLFGRMRTHPIAMRTMFYLLVTLAAIGALVVMNSAIVTVAAATALTGSRPAWLTAGLLGDLTTTFNAVVVAISAAAIAIGLGILLHRIGVHRAVRTAWAAATATLLVPVLFVVILAGAAIPALMYLHIRRGSGDAAYRIWHRVFESDALARGAGDVARFDAMAAKTLFIMAFLVVAFVIVAWTLRIILGVFRDLFPPRSQGTPSSRRRVFVGRMASLVVAALFAALVYTAVWLVLALGAAAARPLSGTALLAGGTLVWLLLVAASNYVRTVLVQYLGDVAIYIMPYRLDAFNDLRREIRRTCFRVADAVYKMRDAAGEPLYHSVIVVGHSLGSVVAYDALNQLIREEDSGSSATAGRSTVAERTHLFLTFGSPLDKTAFIFSLQGRNTSEPREALAASVQPMIRDYALRPRKWMNVWSPWDIISGHLAFYDEDPNGTNPRNVQNVVDPDATTPLVAHVEYWANPLIYRTIHAHL